MQDNRLARCQPSMTTVRLSSLTIGNNVVRFLYYRPPNLVYATSLKQEDDIPLFLGADILAASNTSAKNRCRIHSRYAKTGLASKVTFDGLKIEGINHSSNLWFYSVHGLYAAAFEHLNVNAQRDCLTKLKDVWITHSHMPHRIQEDMKVLLLAEEIEMSFVTAPYLVAIPSKSDDRGSDVHKDTEFVQTENTDQASCSTQREIVSPGKDKVTVALDNCLASCTGPAGVGVPLSKHALELQAKGLLDDRCSAFLKDLLKEYERRVAEEPVSHNVEQNTTQRFDQLVCATSATLGRAFHGFSEYISERVETFKTENINQVYNLPSAKELVHMLFPKCMEVLMLAWICGDDSCGQSGPTNNDHTYSPIPKKPKLDQGQDNEQTPNMYPFIQLILEFANNVLVSGVAHVLYSRLLHSN